MKIGVLTGGGDCPGLNAVIRAIVRKADKYKYEIIGINDGWQGLIKLNYIPLYSNSVTGILPRGGTILGTSRTNPFSTDEGPEIVLANIKKLGLDVLIGIGGDDTLGVAYKLYKMGINTIGVPKTIDNDLSGTDFTFGFDTAVSIVTEALDRLHSTAESHHRVMVVEVMGRHTGWIATYGGLAGGADYILIPEIPFSIDELCESLERRHKGEKNFSIIVAAEGASAKDKKEVTVQSDKKDAFGHARLGGIAKYLSDEIEKRLGFETRHVVLGHLQRGGSPTAYDRILGTRYGISAVELIREGKFGKMLAFQCNKIVAIELEEGVKQIKTVDMETYRIAETFFG
ncbi:MAG: 6-phosphofructokinase [Nitrospirota bacterium]